MSAGASDELRLDEIAGDPDEMARKRRRRDRHYQARTVPFLRLTGMFMLALVVAFHNALVLRSFPIGPYLGLLALMGVYCAVSWLLLARFYEAEPRLADGFLVADLAVYVAALYVSGGDRSWLLPILTARVADQAYKSFRRARFFAHATVAAYSLLLAYLFYVEHRVLDVKTELAKIGVLYTVSHVRRLHRPHGRAPAPAVGGSGRPRAGPHPGAAGRTATRWRRSARGRRRRVRSRAPSSPT